MASVGESDAAQKLVYPIFTTRLHGNCCKRLLRGSCCVALLCGKKCAAIIVGAILGVGR